MALASARDPQDLSQSPEPWAAITTYALQKKTPDRSNGEGFESISFLETTDMPIVMCYRIDCTRALAALPCGRTQP